MMEVMKTIHLTCLTEGCPVAGVHRELLVKKRERAKKGDDRWVCLSCGNRYSIERPK
jgi:transposase-like protein